MTTGTGYKHLFARAIVSDIVVSLAVHTTIFGGDRSVKWSQSSAVNNPSLSVSRTCAYMTPVYTSAKLLGQVFTPFFVTTGGRHRRKIEVDYETLPLGLGRAKCCLERLLQQIPRRQQ